VKFLHLINNNGSVFSRLSVLLFNNRIIQFFKEIFYNIDTDGLTPQEIASMAGGGLFSSPPAIPAPVAPVQDNTAELMLMQQQQRQNELLMQQQQKQMDKEYEADVATARQLKELQVQQAKEAAEAAEREKRAKKEKRDLLYRTAVGVEEDDDDDNLLWLGGDL